MFLDYCTDKSQHAFGWVCDQGGVHSDESAALMDGHVYQAVQVTSILHTYSSTYPEERGT